MKAFNPIHRSNVSPVDIDTFGNTYRELEQGHQRAVQFESALKTEMAKLDLNEAEDGWRQQKIDGIRATLSENTKYGNAAGAVDDLVEHKEIYFLTRVYLVGLGLNKIIRLIWII